MLNASPSEYNPAFFNSLPLFENARHKLAKAEVSKEDIGIFRRYSMHSTLGVILLHRHFLLNQDEKLIEYRGVSTPWTVGISSSSIFGGRITPRCWSISSNEQLQPTEFRFVTPGDDLLEPDFPEDFIDDFYGFLLRRGLAALMGLTMFNATDAISGNREVERTIGRVSVTIPVQEAQFEGVEAAWTFGCQENLSDSEFLNARVGCVKNASLLVIRIMWAEN